MNSVISSTESSLEKPAACRCPPPPDLRAIAETSSSSLLARRLTDPLERFVGRHEPFRIGLVDRERPHLRAPKGRAVAPQRLGDRTNVGAGTDTEIERGDAVSISDDVERVDARPAQRHLHLDTAPVQAIGALAADLDRRCGRDRQLNLAAEAREPSFELLFARRVQALDDVTLGIAGRSAGRQVDLREVALVESHEA